MRAVSFVLGALLLVSLGAQGHEAGGHLQLLQKRTLAGAPGQQAIMMTVDFFPGQVSPAHIHPGAVFAYVLSGEVVSQMAGEPPVHYKTGEHWFEAPGHAHVLARNASGSKPARLLVWMLTPENQAPVQPLPAPAPAPAPAPTN